jgi:hypothetical protein
MGILEGSRAQVGAPMPSKPVLGDGRQASIRPGARGIGPLAAERVSKAFADLSAMQDVAFDLKGGAVAAGVAPDFARAMSAMSGRCQTVRPDASQQAFHVRKHRVFRQRRRDYET